MTTDADERRAAARAADRLAKLLNEAKWCATEEGLELKRAANELAAALAAGAETQSSLLAGLSAEKRSDQIAALCADFLEIVGSKYAFNGAKDGAAVKWLLQQAPLDEVRRRWRIGLRMPSDKWGSVRSIAQLRSRWNDLAKMNTSAGWRDDAAQAKGGFFEGT